MHAVLLHFIAERSTHTYAYALCHSFIMLFNFPFVWMYSSRDNSKYALMSIIDMDLALQCLPYDVLRLILHALTLDDHISVRTTCRIMHHLCYYPCDVFSDITYGVHIYTYPRLRALAILDMSNPTNVYQRDHVSHIHPLQLTTSGQNIPHVVALFKVIEYQCRGASHFHLCIKKTSYRFQECL
jgi:hypothetical protein